MNYKVKVLIKCVAFMLGLIIIHYVAYLPYTHGINIMGESRLVGLANCAFGVIIILLYLIFVSKNLKQDMEDHIKVNNKSKYKEK